MCQLFQLKSKHNSQPSKALTKTTMLIHMKCNLLQIKLFPLYLSMQPCVPPHSNGIIHDDETNRQTDRKKRSRSPIADSHRRGERHTQRRVRWRHSPWAEEDPEIPLPLHNEIQKHFYGLRDCPCQQPRHKRRIRRQRRQEGADAVADIPQRRQAPERNSDAAAPVILDAILFPLRRPNRDTIGSSEARKSKSFQGFWKMVIGLRVYARRFGGDLGIGGDFEWRGVWMNEDGNPRKGFESGGSHERSVWEDDAFTWDLGLGTWDLGGSESNQLKCGDQRLLLYSNVLFNYFCSI